MMDFILALTLFFAIAFSLVKSAKEFEDYGRIRDYLIIGVTIWLVERLLGSDRRLLTDWRSYFTITTRKVTRRVDNLLG